MKDHTQNATIDVDVDEIEIEGRYFSATGEVNVTEEYQAPDRVNPQYWIAFANSDACKSIDVEETIGNDVVKLSKDDPMFKHVIEFAIEKAIDSHYT